MIGTVKLSSRNNFREMTAVNAAGWRDYLTGLSRMNMGIPARCSAMIRSPSAFNSSRFPQSCGTARLTRLRSRVRLCDGLPLLWPDVFLALRPC
jgi:hypothetical protein